VRAAGTLPPGPDALLKIACGCPRRCGHGKNTQRQNDK